IVKLLSKDREEDVSISKEELRAMVDIAGSEGTFKQEESHRIKGVLDFHNLNVKDVLKTPRVEIVGIPNTATYEEVRDIAIHNPFTRYPIYDGDIDNIVGVFHTKYLLSWSTKPDELFKSHSDMEPMIIYEFHLIEW